MTYLYNTLHYYERKIRDKVSLKRKLISSITGAVLFSTVFIENVTHFPLLFQEP